MIPPNSDWYAVVLHGFLCCLQDADYPKTVLGIAQRRLAIAHTLNEMLALQLQRFAGVDPGNQNVPKPHLDGIAVTAN